MTAKAEDLRIGLELDMHMDETSRAGRAGRGGIRAKTRRRRDENAVALNRRRGPARRPSARKRQSNVSNQTRTERERVHRPVRVSRACRCRVTGRFACPCGRARADRAPASCTCRPGSPANLKAT